MGGREREGGKMRKNRVRVGRERGRKRKGRGVPCDSEIKYGM